MMARANLILYTTKTRKMTKRNVIVKKTLILSNRDDPHVSHLVIELDKLDHPWVLFDPDDFPTQAVLIARLGNAGSKSSLLLSDGRPIHLEEAGSVWYRRPTHITANTALPAIEKEFIEREARSGLWGLLRTIPGLWVNHPDAIREASYKARQLQIAHSLGLDIPRTLITNDPDALKQFHIECGGKIIYKLLGFPLYQADDLPISTYTNLVPGEMLNQAHRVTATAHLFQEYIEKVCDLRVIIIGQKVFAAEMYPLSEEARIDFRKD